MVIIWIILGIVLWIVPIIIIFWGMKQELLSKGKKVTLGTIYDYFEPECVAFAFIPVVNLIMAAVFGIGGLFAKYKDLEL